MCEAEGEMEVSTPYLDLSIGCCCFVFFIAISRVLALHICPFLIT